MEMVRGAQDHQLLFIQDQVAVAVAVAPLVWQHLQTGLAERVAIILADQDQVPEALVQLEQPEQMAAAAAAAAVTGHLDFQEVMAVPVRNLHPQEAAAAAAAVPSIQEVAA